MEDDKLFIYFIVWVFICLAINTVYHDILFSTILLGTRKIEKLGGSWHSLSISHKQGFLLLRSYSDGMHKIKSNVSVNFVEGIQ